MQGGQSYWFPQLIVVLSFSYSCLVSSSPSEVGQFNFECCPLVQISSAIHYLPCFGGGLSLCLFMESSALGVKFFAPPPFLWGRFSVPPVPSAVYDRLQFTVCLSVLWGSLVLDVALWLRRSALWSTPHPALGSGLSPTHFQPSLPFLCLFTDGLGLGLAPCPAPFLWCRFRVPHTPSALHV
jgi:hypothetical protein